MRRHGINYDTGFTPMGPESSRTEFDAATVRSEMRIIAEELHCDAVRVSGGDPERLTVAAEAAAAAGLEVWFAPFPCNLPAEELLSVLTECADRAETLRRAGAEVVCVTGCEITLFNPGFLAGDDLMARITALTTADHTWYGTQLPAILAEFSTFMAKVAAAVRPRFGGRITYASGPWEHIDWTPFDIVGVDAYRAAYNKSSYREEIRGHFAHGKPVAATEFGCCAYEGAGDKGGTGWDIVDHEAKPPALDGDYVRDESEQSRYLTELLTVFEEEGLDAAFWFTFAGYGAPHRAGDPRHDLDLATYGVVKMLEPGGKGVAHPDMDWEPKEVFGTMAELYGRHVPRDLRP
ncbi:hypothetical protein [Streptomyces beijiangensis]|uniref:Abortive infection protein n=1 Tax=Streptomyces beijiangensis TaxID=163361 RepID=A0A939JI99_9ACTN|nr:hypothetical protein [Streptomyces beijiangensis]MBO0517081.1 hypothetical protein [Streptomyces beijiangensis]